MKKLLILALVATSTATSAQVRPALAIGPKQDDPRTCDAAGGSKGVGGGAVGVPGASVLGSALGKGSGAPGGFNPETDPRAGNGVLAIGPKQDDPTAPGLAIGPKQDDPRTSDGGSAGTAIAMPKAGLGTVRLPGKFNPDTDPRANGGNGAVAIGPKQDDPSTGGLAIGPKQDDPVAPALRRGALAMSDTCGSTGTVPLPKPR